MKDKELNFDSAFAELQEIQKLIQSEDTSIEKMASYVKRSKELVEFCKSRLRSIEKDIELTLDN